jgi:hypothetical protein
MDKRTHDYLRGMAFCESSVELVRIELGQGNQTDIALADAVTKARDTCDNVRSTLATLDTDHFSDQAAEGFYAIDRYKSGLNAILAYIDNPRPTKVIEARNKLQDGDQSAKQARHGINVRRHVYGLRAVKR